MKETSKILHKKYIKYDEPSQNSGEGPEKSKGYTEKKPFVTKTYIQNIYINVAARYSAATAAIAVPAFKRLSSIKMQFDQARHAITR